MLGETVGLYVGDCKVWRKNTMKKETWISFQEFFTDKYHDLNITQKLSVGHMEYCSMKYVVLTGDIVSTLNNLAISATTNKSI